MRAHTHATTLKMLASVLLVAGAAGVAGLGTFGSFTATTNASQSVAAGRIVMNLSQHPSLGTTMAATGVVPGDSIQRSVQLAKGPGSENFGSVSLTATAQTNNPLSTDATNGLQLSVDSCTSAWSVSGTNKLSCPGTTTNLVATRRVTGTMDLSQVTANLNSTSNAFLRLTMSLPVSAGDTFQDLANVLTFTFDATQRNGTSK